MFKYAWIVLFATSIAFAAGNNTGTTTEGHGDEMTETSSPTAKPHKKAVKVAKAKNKRDKKMMKKIKKEKKAAPAATTEGTDENM